MTTRLGFDVRWRGRVWDVWKRGERFVARGSLAGERDRLGQGATIVEALRNAGPIAPPVVVNVSVREKHRTSAAGPDGGRMFGIGRLIANLRLARNYTRALNRARGELLGRLAAGPIEDEQMTIHELVRTHIEPVLAQNPTLAGDMRPIVRAREHLQEAIRRHKNPLAGSERP